MIAKITPTPSYRPDLSGCMDLRDFFEQNTLSGRFRDWIRRRVVPAFQHTAGILVDYDKYDGCPEGDTGSAREMNYYVRPTGISTVCQLAGLDVPSVSDKREMEVLPTQDLQLSVMQALVASNQEMAARMASLEKLFQDKASLNLSTTGAVTISAKKVEVGQSMDFTLKTHGFSNNHMYEYRKGQPRRSKLYNMWRAQVAPMYPKCPEWLDVTKEFEVHLQYGYLEGFDVHNFVKSSIDALATAWGFNDNKVTKVTIEGAYVSPTAPEGSGFHLKSKNAFIRYVVKQ